MVLLYILVALFGIPSYFPAECDSWDCKKLFTTKGVTDTVPRPFNPVTVRTPLLTISGGGTVVTPRVFPPVSVATPQLTISGGGTVVAPKPFPPVTIVTPKLTISGKTVN